MKMEAKFQENDVDASLSGDEEAEETYEPSPKKRKGANKRVVKVPIDGSRSKGEVHPPPDSWSWRKYGQKPIKGSPYPRGYYRCSSSKGCPARKQVERSRLEPTKLLITYFCEHNHHLLAATTKNHHHPSTAAASTDSPSTSTSAASAQFPPEECAVFANQPDLEPVDNGFAELAGEFGWLVDVGFTLMDCPTFMGASWAHTDVEAFVPINGEDDESLFGDLEDLPESVGVLRRQSEETPCCSATL